MSCAATIRPTRSSCRPSSHTLGDYIEMYCVRGKMDGLYCQSDLLGDELKPGTRYLAIAFGYMSGVTTGLFSEEFTTMDAVQQ